MAGTALRAHSARVPAASRLLRVSVGITALSFLGTLLDAQSFKAVGMSLVWLSNGFLVGVLLCAPKRQWTIFVTLGYVIDFCLNILHATLPGMAAMYSLFNMTEVVIAAVLMYPAIAADPELTEPRQLRSLLLYGVLLAPAIASTMAALYFQFVLDVPFLHAFRSWYAADLLGMAMITPLYLSYHYGRSFSPRSRIEVAGLFVLLCAVTICVFRFTTYPMLWCVLLFLLLLGARLGFTGSAAGLLMVTLLGGYLTVSGFGPLQQGVRLHQSMDIFIFQAFIGLSMFALYITEVAMSGSRRVRSRLEASEARFRSLAEASRDVIVMADMNGRRKYVSPAIEEQLGWTQEDLVGQHYSQITHPDDLLQVREMLQHLRDGGTTSPLAYRSRKRDGTYTWLEATSRLLRHTETDEAYGVVSVTRDISDRKLAEAKMKEAFEAVERLAMMDGLTGVANRRLLDQTLSREWDSSRRDQTTLSLLLIDVDLFKTYNDRYGHLEGDACLRQIARCLQGVLRRPLDLLARYGGEEFVAVLPNTPIEGAEAIAEIARKAVEDCRIAHEGSPYGIVTLSLGCATEIPQDGSSVTSLLQAADAALYRAKSGGRNRTQVADLSGMVLS